MRGVFFGLELQKFTAKLSEAFSHGRGVGQLVEPRPPKIRYPFLVDDGGVGKIYGQERQADFLGELLACGAFLVESGAGGKPLAMVFLAIGVAPPMGCLFHKKKNTLAQEKRGAEAPHAAPDDDPLKPSGNRLWRKSLSVANLVAD